MADLVDIELPEGDAPDSIHLNPASQFHPTVLLPGDPTRAMEIATDQLTAPRMFNHRRGLWGYSGETADGVGLLIQSTGMGGPSAAIVVEELCDLGAQLLVRVGTCAAIVDGPELGDLIVVGSAIPADGTSRELRAACGETADEPLATDDQITALLDEHARASGRNVHSGTIASVDLFYDPAADHHNRERAELGAIAIEMEAATVLAAARRRGVRAACLLGVSDLLGPGDRRQRLPHEQLVELGRDLGRVGAAAVSAAQASTR